jgi:hypothetical protein
MEKEGTGNFSAVLKRGDSWNQRVVFDGGTPLHKAQSGFLNTCDRTVISTGLYQEVNRITKEYSLTTNLFGEFGTHLVTETPHPINQPRLFLFLPMFQTSVVFAITVMLANLQVEFIALITPNKHAILISLSAVQNSSKITKSF